MREDIYGTVPPPCAQIRRILVYRVLVRVKTKLVRARVVSKGNSISGNDSLKSVGEAGGAVG